jgi:hypothetical protein
VHAATSRRSGETRIDVAGWRGNGSSTTFLFWNFRRTGRAAHKGLDGSALQRSQLDVLEEHLTRQNRNYVIVFVHGPQPIASPIRPVSEDDWRGQWPESSGSAIRRPNGAGSLRRSDSIRNSVSARPKVPNYGSAKTRNTASIALGLRAQPQSPGTEFLDAETKRQKSSFNRANACRDQNPENERPEIRAETP